jgi:membrane protein DedA with SNARE-associated domain
VNSCYCTMVVCYVPHTIGLPKTSHAIFTIIDVVGRHIWASSFVVGVPRDIKSALYMY